MKLFKACIIKGVERLNKDNRLCNKILRFKEYELIYRDSFALLAVYIPNGNIVYYILNEHETLYDINYKEEPPYPFGLYPCYIIKYPEDRCAIGVKK